MRREGFFSADEGVDLHFLDWGGTGKPVVLLAGNGGTAQVFGGLAPRLATNFRVLALTRRGHGRSSTPESGYDLETLTSDIIHFLDHMGLATAYLIGHSFAGYEMMKLARDYPDRVGAIVFLDAVYTDQCPIPAIGSDPVWSVLPLQPTAAELASGEAFLDFCKRGRPDLKSIWCEAVEQDLLDNLTIDDRIDPAGARQRRLPIWPQLAQNLEKGGCPDFFCLTMPVLAIVPNGPTNPLLPDDAPEELAQRANAFWLETMLSWNRARTAVLKSQVPQAQIVELDESNHTLFVAKEAETADEIQRFLGAL